MTPPSPTRPIHLALGDIAAARLREACRLHGLSGSVFGIPDDLSHGPLDDGVARLSYMRALYHGFDDWRFAHEDAFAPWRDFVDRLDVDQPDAVIIWSGDNASEGTFLRMACARLAGRAEPLLRVAIPNSYSRPYVGALGASELAALFAGCRALDLEERRRLAIAFARLRDDKRALRQWHAGDLRSVEVDSRDALLLAACTAHWTGAAQVVGAAMALCEHANLMSDLFLSARLGALIEAGSIEADRPRTNLRSYAVRRAHAAPSESPFV